MVSSAVASVVGNSCAIRKAIISPDGEYLAAADICKSVSLWHRTAHGWEMAFKRSFQLSNRRFKALDGVRDMAFSEDGSKLFVASADIVYALDSLTGEETWTLRAKPYLGFMITCRAAIAPCRGTMVAVSNSDGSMELICRETGRHTRWHEQHSPFQLAASADGSRLVGADRFAVGIWDAETGKRLNVRSLHDKAFAMALSPTAPHLALRTLHHLQLIDINTSETLAETQAKPGLPAVAFSQNGERIASLDAEGVSLYDASLNLVGRIETDSTASPPLTAAFGGSSLFVGMSNGSVCQYSLEG